jgi:hypothetical protein
MHGESFGQWRAGDAIALLSPRVAKRVALGQACGFRRFAGLWIATPCCAASAVNRSLDGHSPSVDFRSPVADSRN